MDAAVTFFHQGGPMMYVLLVGGLTAPVPALVALGLGFMRFRVPSAAHALWPVALVLLGVVGALSDIAQAQIALAFASPEVRSTLAAAGLRIAGYPAVTGGTVACVALLLSALLHGIPRVITAGDDARLTPQHALAPGLLGVVGGAVLTLLYGALPGAVTVCGGLGVALSSLRLGESDAPRVAPARLGAAALAMLGGLLAAWAGHLYGHGLFLQAMSLDSPESQEALVAVALASQAQSVTGALLAVGLVGLAGLAAGLPVVRHVTTPRTAVHAALLILLCLLPLAAGAYLESASERLNAQAQPRVEAPSGEPADRRDQPPG